MQGREVLESDRVAAQGQLGFLYLESLEAARAEVGLADWAGFDRGRGFYAGFAQEGQAGFTELGAVVLGTQAGTAVALGLLLRRGERRGLGRRGNVGNNLLFTLDFHRFRLHSFLVVVLLRPKLDGYLVHLQILFVRVLVLEAQWPNVRVIHILFNQYPTLRSPFPSSPPLNCSPNKQDNICLIVEAQMSHILRRGVFSFSSAAEAVVQLKTPKYWKLPENSIPLQTTVTRTDLLKHFRELCVMRQLEIQCDILYKAKKIRGFCHLYDGQEAIPEGMEAALTYDDPLIGAYRIHCQAYKRGYSVREIVGEMLGKANGATKGKGGSMHYYKKSSNFYGGNGIVGAQVPVGVGLAFALKYQKKPNVASILFGDGAANQGQIFEAANMAKLWNLPAFFICENNHYGMGTSVERSSMNTEFYTRGDAIPGFRIEGNNVFEVREAFKWAKNWSIENGPLFIELMCYRYHGHSMSDPGISYRNRQEIQDYRKNKDPILVMRGIGKEFNLASESELDAIEAQVDEQVKAEIALAEKDPEVSLSELATNVYVDNAKHYIRGKLYEESIIPQGQKY